MLDYCIPPNGGGDLEQGCAVGEGDIVGDVDREDTGTVIITGHITEVVAINPHVLVVELSRNIRGHVPFTIKLWIQAK